MGWLSRLFGGSEGQPQQPHQPTLASGPLVGDSPAAALPPPDATAADRPPFLCWLLDEPASMPGLTGPEQQALETIDRVLALATLPAELLPRAANVVPQLIALLRQDDLSLPELVERIGKDPVLAAEVLRQAGSARFNHLGPVQDLSQAIQRLGIEGLQMAIARVVLRPMYQTKPGSMLSQVAPRLWDHADALSRHCAQSARDHGLSGFDGYLVGLLHDSGWTVLFHSLQRGGNASLGPFSLDGAPQFEARAHALFGRAAESWQITPLFSAFASEARRVQLKDSPDPMSKALLQAQGLCMQELIVPGGLQPRV